MLSPVAQVLVRHCQHRSRVARGDQPRIIAIAPAERAGDGQPAPARLGDDVAIARRQPLAGDLRELISAIRIAADIERWNKVIDEAKIERI